MNSKQTKTPRVELTPQMAVYDSLEYNWIPFVMYFHSPNVNTPVVNTDHLGFRLSFQGEMCNSGGGAGSSSEVSFVVGGSTVFGDGATSDRMTIPSLLSERVGHLFLNIGGRAFGSNQELILFNQIAHKYPRINHVVILSGLNELFLSRFREISGYFGPFFFSRQFRDSMNKAMLSRKRKLLRSCLYPIYSDRIDYSRIRGNELLGVLFTSEKTAVSRSTNSHPFDVNYAVSQIRKNLLIWKKMSDSFPFKLRFVLQPVPQWCGKETSQEEEMLFDYLEKEHDVDNIVSQLTKEIYLLYSERIQDVCNQLGIEFYDMNTMLGDVSSSKHWLFVDRAHLTDKGNIAVSDRLYNVLKGH
jgi:hypothetical protein